MGYSNTNADALRARSAYRATSNTTYLYSTSMKAAPLHERKAHETLDPKRLNAVGQNIRESRDSAEHPNTISAFIAFDQTGSMGIAPQLLQQKLATLKGATLRLGLKDLQLGFGAWGDAQNAESAPLQVGQFESGLEFEEVLNNIFLEGSGGANHGETSGLLMWYLAYHSALDSLEKRGKKGYLFLVGDEVALPYVTQAEVKTYVGEDVQGDIPIEQVFADVTKMYEVFFLLYDTNAARQQKSLEFWTKHLGDKNVIPLQSLETVAETIALVLSASEGLDGAVEALVAEGSSSEAIEVLANAVAVKVGTTTAAITTVSDGTITAEASTDLNFL